MRVKFYATLRQIVDSRTVELPLVPGGTARDLLTAATSTYPRLAPLVWTGDGGLRDYIKVFIDGREIAYLAGLDTIVPPDANVDIFPPVAGG